MIDFKDGDRVRVGTIFAKNYAPKIHKLIQSGRLASVLSVDRLRNTILIKFDMRKGSAPCTAVIYPQELEYAFPVPTHEPDGQFETFSKWVNHASSWIGGENAYCADAKDRRCLIGADFMRARDEGTFPVRFWFGCGGQTSREQKKNKRLAAQRWRRGA